MRITKPAERTQLLPASNHNGGVIPGQRGGARYTITGCLGEYQADALFHAMGHKKLSHGGKQAGLLDLPQGRGIDGIWHNKYPPLDYLITETKFTTEPGAKPKLSKGQISDTYNTLTMSEDSISQRNL